MKRVLVITTNLRQASYRLWIAGIRALLAERGFDFDVQVRSKRLFERRALFRRAGGYDAVILFRKLLDPSDARLLRRHAKRIFYALDDAVMYHAHPVGCFSRWRTKRRFEATAKIADHVVAGNDYLADIFRRRGNDVTVLPTCIDASKYAVKPDERGGGVALVWIGSSSTLGYLDEIMPAVGEAAQRLPGLRLITIADRTIDRAPVPVEHIAWSEQEEAAALVRGDIGIAPTPDDQWTRGKCGFKILQYMAAGLPVIASPVGANAQIVTPETGVLATTPRDWTDAIVRLAADLELRRRMGAAGRARVEAEYPLVRAAETWARLLA